MQRWCWVRRSLAVATVAWWSVAASGQPLAFDVRQGYLSTSVRELVANYGWSLVWTAGEDRMIDYPFQVPDESLRGTLTRLLEMYEGQFVADLYEGNRVVVIDTPPPRVRVLLRADEDETGVEAAAIGHRQPVAARSEGAVSAQEPVIEGAAEPLRDEPPPAREAGIALRSENSIDR